MIDCDRPWEAPGDQLYATGSAYRQSLFAIKDDHPGDEDEENVVGYLCRCYRCRDEYCAIEGDHDHWHGSSDAMRWYPGQREIVECFICGQSHGVVCPKRNAIAATRINFAGSPDYFEFEPYADAQQLQPRAHREDVA